MSDYPMLISNKLHSFRNFVMQKDSIQKVAAQFGGKRLNEEFKSLLMKYNL